MAPLVLLSEIKAGVYRLTLNDETSLNAMGEEMAREFSLLIEKLAAIPELRALVLQGAGKAFSAGGRLDMLQEKIALSFEENERRMLEFYRHFLSFTKLGVPTIAACNGSAIGAGLCLACAADFRICVSQAKFGFTFSRLGLHPGMGATFFVPRVLGAAKARELLFSGRVIGADEALRIGLVSEVVESPALEQAVMRLVEELLGCGPRALRSLRTTLDRDCERELSESLALEARAQAHSYADPEFAEGLQAVREKRPACF